MNDFDSLGDKSGPGQTVSVANLRTTKASFYADLLRKLLQRPGTTDSDVNPMKVGVDKSFILDVANELDTLSRIITGMHIREHDNTQRTPRPQRDQAAFGLAEALRGNLRGDPNYMICSNDKPAPNQIATELRQCFAGKPEDSICMDAADEIDRLRAWLSFIAKVDDHAVQALNGAPSPLEDNE